MSFSIIIPTLGRSTLARSLASCLREMQVEDEIVLVTDGVLPSVSRLLAVDQPDPRVRLVEGPLTRQGGYLQRNLGIQHARGSWLLFMDDDDEYLEGGVNAIREATASGPFQPHMFRMRHRGELLWRDHEVRMGNISTQMFVTPNLPFSMGSWSGRPTTGKEGDYVFVTSTLGKWPRGSLVWRDEVVAELVRHGAWEE